ncbi:MAG: hypothetical protein ABF649_16455 [Bacillus sp. (in: firmicutes)]
MKKISMWVIIVYLKNDVTMFEFTTENKARKAFDAIQDVKILSEVVYYNDSGFTSDSYLVGGFK